MNVIEFAGYTGDEKLAIGKQFLILRPVSIQGDSAIRSHVRMREVESLSSG